MSASSIKEAAERLQNIYLALDSLAARLHKSGIDGWCAHAFSVLAVDEMNRQADLVTQYCRATKVVDANYGELIQVKWALGRIPKFTEALRDEEYDDGLKGQPGVKAIGDAIHRYAKEALIAAERAVTACDPEFQPMFETRAEALAFIEEQREKLNSATSIAKAMTSLSPVRAAKEKAHV